MRLASVPNARATQFPVKRKAGVSLGCSSPSLRHGRIRDGGIPSGHGATIRSISTRSIGAVCRAVAVARRPDWTIWSRFCVCHASGVALIGAPGSRIAAAKVASRNACHAAPVAGTATPIVSIAAMAPRAIPAIVVVSSVVITRARIAMVIRKWVPTDLIAKRDIYNESHQGGTPPASLPIVLTARAPRPGVVVIDPATEVVWSPAPGFVPDPGPAVGINPHPLTVTIRGPIVITGEGACVWTPDPAVIVGERPGAI